MPLVEMHYKKNGFTLIEVLLVIGIVGIIATMMVSIVASQLGEKTFVLKVKSIAQQISSAGVTYAKANPITTTPPSANIADLMAYSGKATAGNLVTAAITCSAAAPCYRFSDKSVLVALTPTVVSVTDPCTYFAYDPDGTGSKGTVVLVYKHASSRITTRDAYIADGQAIEAGIPAIADPSYVKEWTKL